MNFPLDQKNIADAIAKGETSKMAGGHALRKGTDDVYRIIEVYVVHNCKAPDDHVPQIGLYTGPRIVVDYTVVVVIEDQGSSFIVDFETFQKEYTFVKES